MSSWPGLNTRVTVRYRRPVGSVPPLTDAVGHLLQVQPSVQVRTKAGAVVEIAAADVVAVRPLTDTPVRTAQIRALEHAAAFAQPGVEHTWIEGWFLRAGVGATGTDCSAVALDVCADLRSLPAIVAWYAQRGLSPRLSAPDRLLSVPGAVASSYRMLVRDIAERENHCCIELRPLPGQAWLQATGSTVAEATAVLDGEVMFGFHPDAVTARAAVTDAPDGTRWVGLSVLSPADTASSAAAARQVIAALSAWGVRRGASRAHLRVADGDASLGRVAESSGFGLHHRGRLVVAAPS